MQTANEKEAIRNIQRYLRQLSYEYPEIPTPPVDGIFETTTANSLKAFQQMAALPVTGKADRETFERLFEEYEASLLRNSSPVPIAHFPRISTGYALQEGDESFLVRLLQYALRELSIIYGGAEDLEETGVYDTDTADAVKDFQKRNGLPQTGEVDRITWDTLANVYNRTFEGYQPQ